MDIFRRSAAQERSFFVARGPAGGVKPARALLGRQPPACPAAQYR